MIRNTDRGSDNWMVRYNGDTTIAPAESSIPNKIVIDSFQVPTSSPEETIININDKGKSSQQQPSENPLPTIQVAVIDNGLAFPYKHPDKWRSYPYGWSFLPIAKVPFSEETRTHVLHLLTSQEWWKETLDGLKRLMEIDEGFDDGMWK